MLIEPKTTISTGDAADTKDKNQHPVNGFNRSLLALLALLAIH